MKIGIISQWYPPEPASSRPASPPSGGPGARGPGTDWLSELPRGEDLPRLSAALVGHGQRRARRRPDAPGPALPESDDSPVRRAANYLSSRRPARCRLRYLGAPTCSTSTTHRRRRRRCPRLRLIHRVPAVLHVQDVWPDRSRPRRSAPAAAGMVGRLPGGDAGDVPSASSIAVIAPSMRQLLIDRGADPGKVRVVLNWTDEIAVPAVAGHRAARRSSDARDRFTVMHAGNIGPFQDTVSAIQAAAAIKQFGLVDLVFVGSGIEERNVGRLAAELNADNVRFIPRQEPSAMAELYGAADFQLVSLRDLPGPAGHDPVEAAGRAVVRLAGRLASAAGDCARAGGRHDGAGSRRRRRTGRRWPTTFAGGRAAARASGPRWAGAPGRATCLRCP